MENKREAKKRTVATIKQFDYTSKEVFLKDIEKMKQKGYHLIHDGMYNGKLDPQELNGDDTWKFTAYFVKSSMI